jgi:CheY-specific phosphatase CheX
VAPNDIHSALSAAVEEVLETMFFSSVLASSNTPEPTGEGAEPVFRASLAFQGDACGNLGLAIPIHLAQVVSSGFLGMEEQEVSDSEVGEVVGEMANMICGSVLSRLESESTFHISHPELGLPELPVRKNDFEVVRWFYVGDGGFTISLGFSPRK